MLRYNQRTPFRNTGGYSIESYEPDNQQEEKPLNQTFFNYPLVNMENTRNNISLNQTNIVPQYVEPNKTLTNPRYISNPTINQFNPANLSYSLQYNKNPKVLLKLSDFFILIINSILLTRKSHLTSPSNMTLGNYMHLAFQDISI